MCVVTAASSGWIGTPPVRRREVRQCRQEGEREGTRRTLDEPVAQCEHGPHAGAQRRRDAHKAKEALRVALWQALDAEQGPCEGEVQQEARGVERGQEDELVPCLEEGSRALERRGEDGGVERRAVEARGRRGVDAVGLPDVDEGADPLEADPATGVVGRRVRVPPDGGREEDGEDEGGRDAVVGVLGVAVPSLVGEGRLEVVALAPEQRDEGDGEGKDEEGAEGDGGDRGEDGRRDHRVEAPQGKEERDEEDDDLEDERPPDVVQRERAPPWTDRVERERRRGLARRWGIGHDLGGAVARHGAPSSRGVQRRRDRSPPLLVLRVTLERVEERRPPRALPVRAARAAGAAHRPRGRAPLLDEDVLAPAALARPLLRRCAQPARVVLLLYRRRHAAAAAAAARAAATAARFRAVKAWEPLAKDACTEDGLVGVALAARRLVLAVGAVRLRARRARHVVALGATGRSGCPSACAQARARRMPVGVGVGERDGLLERLGGGAGPPRARRRGRGGHGGDGRRDGAG